MGTLLGRRPGAGLGDVGGAGGVVFEARQGQLPEATAAGLGRPEQRVGQHRHQGQGAQAEDGGGGCSRLDLEEQQSIDG